jgi:hypothetical protein
MFVVNERETLIFLARITIISQTHNCVSSELQYLKFYRGRKGSRGSSFGIATGYGAGRPGFESRQEQGISVYSTALRPPLGSTQPPIQLVLGTGSAFLGCKAGVKLTIHLPLAPRSRKAQLYYQFPYGCIA